MSNTENQFKNDRSNYSDKTGLSLLINVDYTSQIYIFIKP